MNNIFNIYFGSNLLVITPNTIDGIETTISTHDISSAESLCKLLEKHSQVAIVTPNTIETFDNVTSHFKRVTAAGGLCENSRGEFLMIYRNSRWDLPKGHLEQNETLEECAVREVEEETGVGEIVLGEKICHTLHIYKMRGRWEIKQTHWFRMKTSFDKPLTPQREEGIMRVAWCSKESIRHFILNSYPTIQQVYNDSQTLK